MDPLMKVKAAAGLAVMTAIGVALYLMRDSIGGAFGSVGEVLQDAVAFGRQAAAATVKAANQVATGTVGVANQIAGGTTQVANQVASGTVGAANQVASGTTQTANQVASGTTQTANQVASGTTQTANTAVQAVSTWVKCCKKIFGRKICSKWMSKCPSGYKRA